MRIQTIALRHCWIALGAALSGAFGCSDGSGANVNEAVGTTQSALSQTGEIRIGPSATVPAGDGIAHVAYGAGQFVAFGTREHGRITDSGANLDPEGIVHPFPMPSALGAGTYRALAHTGTYAIALSTTDGRYVPRAELPSAIFAYRFAQDGSFVDATEITTGNVATVREGNLACGAGHCLAAYGYDFGGALALFRVDSASVTLVERLSLPAQVLESLRVRFDGTQFLVVFGAVQAERTRITWLSKRVPLAAPRELAPAPIGTAQYGTGSGSVATRASGSLFVYTNATPGGNAVFARGLNAQGEPTGEILHLAGVGARAAFTAVASDGERYMALWKACSSGGPCTVHGAVVDAAGAVGPIRDYGSAQSKSQSAPELVWGGNQYLAVWDEPPLRELYARRLDRAGAVIDRQAVLRENVVPREDGPALAWNGCSYLASYYQSTSVTTGEVVGTFLDGNGNARQTLPFAMAREFSPAANERNHDLVRSDSGFLRVSDVFVTPQTGVQRVSFEGVLLDEQRLTLAPTDAPMPAQYSLVAAGEFGPGWLAAVERMEWVDGNYAQSTRDILLQQVSAGGAIIPLQPLTTAPGGQHSPQIAANTKGALAVWTDSGAAASASSIWGAGISFFGYVGTPFQISSFPSEYHTYAHVSSDDADYLVAWQQGQTLSAQKISAEGVAQSAAIQLSQAGRLNRVVYDGRTFLVFTVHDQPDNTAKLAVRRVSRAGALLDADPVWLSTPTLPFTEPNGFDVASDGLGRTLFSYTRTDGRLAGRVLTASDASPFPSSCPPVGPAPPPSCSFGAPERGTSRAATALSALLLAAASRVSRRRASQSLR